MIHLFLKLIISELNVYLDSVSLGDGPFTVAGNVGLASVFARNDSFIDNKALAILVDLGEELTSKNNTNYRSNGTSWEKSFPTVHLNSFILFSVNINSYSPNSGNENNSFLAIEKLSQIISFFQKKRLFKLSSFPMHFFDTILLVPSLVKLAWEALLCLCFSAWGVLDPALILLSEWIYRDSEAKYFFRSNCLTGFENLKSWVFHQNLNNSIPGPNESNCVVILSV